MTALPDALSSTANTDVLARAEALAASGQFQEAIAYGTQSNRNKHDPNLERKLVEWRRQAFDTLPAARPRPDWPPLYPDPFDGSRRPPEIAPRQLTPETLGAGIRHYGSLLVRNLISAEQADCLVRGIDRAFEDCQRHANGYKESAATEWYSRFPLSSDNFIGNSRQWVESGSGVYLADSPRMMFQFAELINSIGIVTTIEGYLGERPALSIGKTTLRRVPKTMQFTGWHQDGAFLGKGIRSVNLWLCLSHCGQDASGLEIVPRRLDHIVETGTHGAFFNWSVGDGLIERVAGDTPVVSPIFRPGDALLFDELLLHRTSLPPRMTHDRYAIESWFFAPSSYPLQQEPLVV
jgi:hypothetical protein